MDAHEFMITNCHMHTQHSTAHIEPRSKIDQVSVSTQRTHTKHANSMINFLRLHHEQWMLLFDFHVPMKMCIHWIWNHNCNWVAVHWMWNRWNCISHQRWWMCFRCQMQNRHLKFKSIHSCKITCFNMYILHCICDEYCMVSGESYQAHLTMTSHLKNETDFFSGVKQQFSSLRNYVLLAHLRYISCRYTSFSSNCLVEHVPSGGKGKNNRSNSPYYLISNARKIE